LTDNDGWVNLLSEFWFTLLDRSHDQISGSGGWKSVQTTFDTGNSNNVEGLGTSIVGAVHDGGDWESH